MTSAEVVWGVAPDRRSRLALRRPTGKGDWITTRCAVKPAGIGSSHSPYGPWRCWRYGAVGVPGAVPKKGQRQQAGLAACWPSRSPDGPPTAEWASGAPAVLVPGIGRAEDRQQILASSHRRPWHQPIAKFSSDKRREASVTDVQLYA